jgi:hypothetical protein
MGLWDKLKQASSSLRKLRLSRGPDSYFQYKLGRDSDRKEADRAAEWKRDEAERGRQKAKREHGYEERYTRERDNDS